MPAELKRYYGKGDFSLYNRGKMKEKSNYMHANQAVRGLVEHPKDWPWSSWGFYWEGDVAMVRIDVGE